MSDTGMIRDAGIAVQGGRIADAGPAQDVLAKYPEAEVTPLSGRLVTPGLVDCHTHLVWAGDRSGEFVRRCRGESYQEIAAQGGGILASAAATQSASVEQLAEGIVDRAALLLSLGTTAFEIKASYGLGLEASRRELEAIRQAKPHVPQCIATTFMGAHAIPPERTRGDYIAELLGEMIPMAADYAEFNDVFCEEGAFTVEECRSLLESGIAHGMRAKIHSDEFNSLGGTALAVELRAVSCDHLLVVSEEDIERLAASDTVAVAMPGTAFYLDKPYAPARKLVDSGCVLALGSDFNPGSSQVPSLAFAMGLAVSRMGLSPEEALTASTQNAAAAIRVQKGSLAVGSDADFCIWPCATLEQMVYQFPFIRPTEVYLGGARAL
jgi:imidazolonepropionase